MYHSFKTCFLLTMASALFVYSSLTFAKTSEITTLTTPLKDNLVILQYHHVSNNTPKITSTPPDVFAEHLAYLYEHFNVVALPDASTLCKMALSYQINLLRLPLMMVLIIS